jgi:tyrosinase
MTVECGFSKFTMFGVHFLALGLILLQTWAMPTVLRKAGHGDRPSLVLPTAASRSTDIAALQIERLARIALSVATDKVATSKDHGCSEQDLRVRRNWRAFSSREKKAYIKSVLCLQKLPARTPANLAAGAKTRYDDFVATHINQTLEIHYTVLYSNCGLKSIY